MRSNSRVSGARSNVWVSVALATSLLACGNSKPGPNSGNASGKQATATITPKDDAPAEVTKAIAALMGSPAQGLDPTANEARALVEIYKTTTEAPFWVDEKFRPTSNAHGALAALTDARAEGLEPSDYRVVQLAALNQTLEAAQPPRAEDAAAFDLGLSLSLMRYLHDFHRGRVDPRTLGFLMTLPPDDHDYAALVRSAALESHVKETIESMTPPLVQYRILRSMLPRYRELADDKTLPAPPKAPTKSLKPGGTFAELGALRARLVALGDMAEGAAPADPALYDGAIVDGVKKFQERHGLEGDGVLGKTTWTALNVPLTWRAHQIELAMERMRWLPHLGERPFVAVNIPMFHLWGWDSVPEDGKPTFDMGVIVGKALDTRTPVFLEEMKYMIFQPYWNVPKSILQAEVLPAIRKNPGYLDRQDMEIVDGQSDDAKVVSPSPENLRLLAANKLRVRQRPGVKNALGQVKFMFPNDENVYLHSTPAPELFGRARRDFSHGCVRVESPVELAKWVLQDQPEWTEEKIRAAMNGKPSQRVELTRPIRVVLYYVTATVIPSDKSMHFADDIYDQDPKLDQALHARKQPS